LRAGIAAHFASAERSMLFRLAIRIANRLAVSSHRRSRERFPALASFATTTPRLHRPPHAVVFTRRLHTQLASEAAETHR